MAESLDDRWIRRLFVYDSYSLWLNLWFQTENIDEVDRKKQRQKQLFCRAYSLLFAT